MFKWLARDLAADLRQMPWNIVVNAFGASFWMPRLARTGLYRLMGVDISLASTVLPGAYFRTKRLTIMPGSTVNHRCYFDNRALVTIGSNVGVGIGVAFITSGHDSSDPMVRAGAGSVLPIVVANGAWIGSMATILPGVTIGEGCVIAAGAVVTKDTAAHGLYGGVPAKRLRELPG